MFCYQCQETAKGTGCNIMGVCGKNPKVSNFQDLLIWTTKLISSYNSQLKENKITYNLESKANRFIINSLFITITNANFDDEAIVNEIKKGFILRDELKKELIKNSISLNNSYENLELATYEFSTIEDLEKVSKNIGVLRTENEDIRSLRELLTYGLKGMAAYVEHAQNLGKEDPTIFTFIENALLATVDESLGVNELIPLVLQCGEFGVKAMALLDNANTSKYGNPEITEVNIGVGNRPGILISGHDLKDLEDLLEQSANSGVDIYTHSEMLPGHYYPKFKEYPHFFGNYGNAWWKQKEEFESFNGPIVFTTNCIVPPSGKNTYSNRVFTTNATGFPGWTRIERDENGKKDFSQVIEMAKKCTPPTEIESGKIIGGFAHNQVLALADKVIDAVKSGAIKNFVVMAGCDGRSTSRNYYTDFAKALPMDSVILTAGCAKYKYNKLNLGDIGGIPRVLDAGQCNDSYSLVVIALALKDAFGLDDINDLPITYNIAWYEQKAVIVLLALLYLGVKNIHLGPTLPGFLSENVVKVLVENFGISGIDTVENDMKKFGIK
ncbi:hydroxylamine reductase [uncultured Cetobacterium sp.]|uniref:hydroxylamine reductase n=1 Tax=uncultured Cetobacterium sp. TaxID=527638 RepID=UPI00261ED5F2|nr:hydroxylamine reductase [uncultured Cetobacterium sp.]